MKTILLLIISLLPLSAYEIPSNSNQALVGIAPSWNSSTVTLTLYEKINGQWKPILKPWTGRLGKKGLAWGRGNSPAYTKPYQKKEGDWRSPAGVFKIATPYGIYGTKTNLTNHSMGKKSPNASKRLPSLPKTLHRPQLRHLQTKSHPLCRFIHLLPHLA